MQNKYLISIVGPTAVGKTDLSIRLAKNFNSEIISADSRQFYRELEIGTAKPNRDQLTQVRHYFVNSLSIHDDFNVGRFESQVMEKLDELFEERDIVILVGGSGLFCKAVWEGLDEMPDIRKGLREEIIGEFERDGLGNLLDELKEADPEYYEKVDKNNQQRIIRAVEVIRSTGLPFSSFRKGGRVQKSRNFENIKIGLEMDRDKIYSRIDLRMDLMLEKGLEKEAKELYQFKNLNALQTVGYQEFFPYFEGQYDYVECVRLLKRNSRRYAKRQLTWFRKDHEIKWFAPTDYSQIIRFVSNRLNA